MKIKRIVSDHRYFLIFYGAMYVLFLWPLLTFQRTFIFGDYWLQHYPWAYEYARCLKTGRLPYWVPSVAGGFPLVAEGQVGAYYLPHLLFYSILPFSIAYSSLIFLHVLAGGLGFYIYGRRLLFSKEAAAFTAVLFSFSSAYGGCFSNTASLKAITWLPWSLVAWEYLTRLSGRHRFLWISILGAMFSQMWTAGSSQIALYAVVYLFCFWMIKEKGRFFLDFIMINLIGLVLSLPQWTASLELLPVSVRAAETAAFAMTNSMMPTAFIAMVYPKWGNFMGASIYLGGVGTLLLVIALLSKKSRIEKIYFALALIFLFFALGRYNPLYSFLIQKFSLTMFRGPNKLIFFSTLSLLVLAGFGYERLIQTPKAEVARKRFINTLYTALTLVIAAPLLGGMAFEIIKGPLLSFARKSGEVAFASKSDPFRDIAYYHSKADQIFEQVGKLFSYQDPWNLLVILLFLVSALAILWVLQNKSADRAAKIILPVVLGADLLFFGAHYSVGFTGNVREFPAKLSAALTKTIRDHQQIDNSSLIEWAREQNEEILPANVNLLYSLNHAGGYSPLLIKRYYDFSKDLGISDSSLGRRPRSEEVWKKESGVLKALGVSQVLSNEKLLLPGLSLDSVINERNFTESRRANSVHYLYGVSGFLPLVYAVYDVKVIPDEKERLAYLKSDKFQPGKEVVVEILPDEFRPANELYFNKAGIVSRSDAEVIVKVNTSSDAFMVFRNVFYPRWKAEVDGKIQTLNFANHVFSGVFLKKGAHQVRFFYDEGPHKFSETVAIVGWLSLLMGNIFLIRIKR